MSASSGKARSWVSRSTVLLMFLGLALGCSGGKRSQGDTADLRVPECEAYGRKMAACFERPELASMAPSLARDDAERERMRASCSLSLQRLTATCR
jgi:hypothetical protein